MTDTQKYLELLEASLKAIGERLEIVESNNIWFIISGVSSMLTLTPLPTHLYHNIELTPEIINQMLKECLDSIKEDEL